jgi:hypothetical protein
MPHPVVIEALRTPRGAAKETGALHSVTPMELLAGVLRDLARRTGVDTNEVADGVFGCVTQTGEQGGNIGKSACLLADWSPHLSAVTINRYCASGLSAVNWAAQQARDAHGCTPGRPPRGTSCTSTSIGSHAVRCRCRRCCGRRSSRCGCPFPADPPGGTPANRPRSPSVAPRRRASAS